MADPDTDSQARSTGAGPGGLTLLRRGARSAGARVSALADREDVARYTYLARALRNIGGLPDRPAHELVLGAVTIGVMVATDSWVVDLLGNLVAVLLVDHPHHTTVKESPGVSHPDATHARRAGS